MRVLSTATLEPPKSFRVLSQNSPLGSSARRVRSQNSPPSALLARNQNPLPFPPPSAGDPLLRRVLSQNSPLGPCSLRALSQNSPPLPSLRLALSQNSPGPSSLRLALSQNSPPLLLFPDRLDLSQNCWPFFRVLSQNSSSFSLSRRVLSQNSPSFSPARRVLSQNSDLACLVLTGGDWGCEDFLVLNNLKMLCLENNQH